MTEQPTQKEEHEIASVKIAEAEAFERGAKCFFRCLATTIIAAFLLYQFDHIAYSLRKLFR